MTTTTATVLAKINSLHRAAPVIANGQAEDADALAQVIHANACGCEGAPTVTDRELAAALVAAGYRADHGARSDLAELLAAVATAWVDATHQPISVREQLRWSQVCVLAVRIASKWARR